MNSMTARITEKYVLLSIQPFYATKIFEGIKTVELRRSFPAAEPKQWIILYVSSPVKEIWGAIRIDRVLQESTSNLWQQVKEHASVTKAQFDSYYSGTKFGCGIFIDKIYRYPHPIPLTRLRDCLSNFSPPQSFRYLDSHHATNLNLLDFECHWKSRRNAVLI